MRIGVPVVLAGLLFAACPVFGSSPESRPGFVGRSSPAFQAKDVNGAKVDGSLLAREGKVTVLNFWGLRCSACLEEMPHLNNLQERYKGRVVVLGVNVDGVGAEALEGQIKKQKLDIRFQVLPDPEFLLSDMFKMLSAPLTVVIDAKGIVRYWHENFEPGDEVKLDALVAGILAEIP